MNSRHTTTADGGQCSPPFRCAWRLRDLVRPMRNRSYSSRNKWNPRLLAHYPAVVEFLYTHRYATADQVQRYFATFIKSDRTARYQLRQMEQLGLIARAATHSTAPHFPLAYHATSR